MSRPKKEIDWKKVDVMLEAHCNGTEVAAQFDMHPETFYDRVRAEFNIGFTEYMQQKRCKGKSNLRAKQYQQAMTGCKTLLIWLGRNWLAQREEPKEDKEFDGKLSNLLDKLLAIEGPEAFKAETEEEDDRKTDE